MDDQDRAKDLFFKGLACLENRDFYNSERYFIQTLEFTPHSIPTLNNLAVAQYEAGKKSDAAITAQKVLEIDHHNIDAHLMLSTCQKDEHRYDETLRTCQKIISIDPTIAEAHCNLGYALSKAKRYEEALGCFDRAVELNPQFADAFLNRGHAFTKIKRYGDAFAAYNHALALKPDFVEAWMGRGNAYLELKRHDEAFAAYDRARALKPDLAEAWLGCGNAYFELKRHNEAFLAYDRALALRSDLAEAWLGRGNACFELKRHDEAFAAYDRALAVKPDLAEAWLGRANGYLELKSYDEALAAYDRALALKPDLVEAWIGRGNVMYLLKRHDEALAAYNQALAIEPDRAEALLGRGLVLFSLNQDRDALECFDKSLALKPDLPEAQWNKALLKLSLGEYEEGWKLYEWRWKNKRFPSPVRHFTQPLWLNNSDIAYNTILIHSEQGLGDTIQFSRYLKFFEDKKSKLLFEVPKPLASLFKSLHWHCEIIVRGEAIPPFDVHCPLITLPLAFQTRLETIPANVPYVVASDEKKNQWAKLIGAPAKKPRIGLAWSGNPYFAGGNDISRPIPLSLLGGILSDDFEWYRLQKDLRESDKKALTRLSVIKDLSHLFDDFSDVAALIEQLDLVISIDTSIAHLAGAMAKRVWILLPFHPDFRWLRERMDSPWYPTARLYRQTTDGDWTDVLKGVSADLRHIGGRLSMAALLER